MTTVEILRKARGLLVARGWYQGNFVPPDADLATCPICLEGAINCAVTGDPTDDAHGQDEYLALLKRAIRTPSVFRWNDDRERTVDDIMWALDRAIALAEDEEVTP